MRKNYSFLVILCFVLFTSCSSKKINPPNVVLIVVDDLGYSDTSATGSDYYETPTLEKLVQEGVSFTQAYSAAAVCSPTRAAIVTGKYPSRLELTTHIPSLAPGWKKGVPPNNNEFTIKHPASKNQSGVRNRNYLPLEELTLAEILKKEGYSTGYIGKWHLGSEEFHPEHQGFDWQIGVSNYGQPMSYYSPYKKKFRGELLKMQSLQNNIRPEEYLTDRLGREAVQFIQQHQKEPFFLQLSFYAVHTPIQPPKEEKHYFDHKLKGEHHKNEAYAAMIKKTDENIGRVLQSLEALDLEENTLVIVTSDNGGFLNVTKNIGIRKGKGYAYEGGVKVPMWMKWPNKIKKGVSFDSPVSSIDIMPTILGSLQIDISKSTSMDGVNLMDQITLNKTLDRDLFWHFPHFRGGDIVPYTMVRSGDYKLIKRYKGKEFELFNLAQDPEEKTDLSEKQTDKVEVLNNRIEIWLKQTQASIPLQ